eukprot:Skav216998  [mRNA]  locus=scaffold1803:12382:14261:+ [translate_table: standard]
MFTKRSCRQELQEAPGGGLRATSLRGLWQCEHSSVRSTGADGVDFLLLQRSQDMEAARHDPSVAVTEWSSIIEKVLKEDQFGALQGMHVVAKDAV